MNFQNVMKFVTEFLPLLEEGASFFIHNHDSQKKFTTVAGDVNTVAAVANAVANANKNAGDQAVSGATK